MFKKVKKIELRGHICAVGATERFERMDIFSSQNPESVNTLYFWRTIKYLKIKPDCYPAAQPEHMYSGMCLIK